MQEKITLFARDLKLLIIKYELPLSDVPQALAMIDKEAEEARRSSKLKAQSSKENR